CLRDPEPSPALAVARVTGATTAGRRVSTTGARRGGQHANLVRPDCVYAKRAPPNDGFALRRALHGERLDRSFRGSRGPVLARGHILIVAISRKRQKSGHAI